MTRLSGYQRFAQAKILEGMSMEEAARHWADGEGISWLVQQIPEEIVTAYQEWYGAQPDEVKRRENLFRNVITRKNLESLSDEDFVEAMFNFAHEGGGVQSGGNRTAGLLRKTIESDVGGFRRFVLEPFDPDCDVAQWLERSKGFKYFGKGIATIYLCWVDQTRYAILNNKTKDALQALGFSIPADFVERYKTVLSIQSALIQRFPDLGDFKKADYLNHFLVATDEGQALLDYHFAVDGEPMPDHVKGFKIAPDEQASMWPKWRDEGIATIGWDALGDMSGMDWDGFVEVRDAVGKEHGWTNTALNQVWKFSQIPVGSIIVANKGTSEVVGIGRVVRGYYFEDTGEHCHRLGVDWYDSTPRKVNMPGWKKTLVPLDEETLKKILGPATTPFIPNQEALFTATSFDLLAELQASPTKETYQAKKDELQKHVMLRFRELFRSAVAKLPPSMTESDYLETKKHAFSVFLKNDYGKGGAHDYYWGAVYRKGWKKGETAQLYLTIFPSELSYGFYIGDNGAQVRELFAQRCQEYRTELLPLLQRSFDGTPLRLGWRNDNEEDTLEDGNARPGLTLAQWLQDPASLGIQASWQIPKDEVLDLSAEVLAERVAQAWTALFPLFLLATDGEPLPAIRAFLDGLDNEETALTEEEDAEEERNNPVYSIAQVAEETGFGEEEITQWIGAIERKGQGILYGPPGTGKTFMARQLARHFIGGGDGFWELVQFHPAYAYEDFMQGIRPQTKNGALEYVLEPGRFLNFCNKSEKHKGICVLITDEINRANLSRVFGELMYLLEYRNEAIPLAGGKELKIPPNVRIIGTMNTADRSIALVDHALRRRFAFIGLYPRYEILQQYHEERDHDVQGLIQVLKAVNSEIGDPHYEIGISFFLHEDLPMHMESIWRMEIEPYLEEYFFDKTNKVKEFRWERIKERI